MQTNNRKTWSEGLRFVQFMKNRAYHDGIRRSPYQAMFGCDPNVGLSTMCLPNDAIQDINTEEELEDLLNSITIANKSPVDVEK